MSSTVISAEIYAHALIKLILINIGFNLWKTIIWERWCSRKALLSLQRGILKYIANSLILWNRKTCIFQCTKLANRWFRLYYLKNAALPVFSWFRHLSCIIFKSVDSPGTLSAHLKSCKNQLVYSVKDWAG